MYNCYNNTVIFIYLSKINFKYKIQTHKAFYFAYDGIGFRKTSTAIKLRFAHVHIRKNDFGSVQNAFPIRETPALKRYSHNLPLVKH